MRSFVFLTTLLFSIAILSSKVVAQSKNSPAIDFTTSDTDGNVVNLFETLDQGKTVILFFFSNSCIHCHLQAPIVDSIYRQFGSGEDNLVVWGFADASTNPDEILEFIDSTNITFPCFGTTHETDLFQIYDISYTPQLFIVCDYLISESISFYEIIANLNYCFPTSIIEENISSPIIAIDNGNLSVDSELQINSYGIYDLTGKCIIFNRFDGNSISVQQKLESNQLYFIKINFKNGSCYSEKLFIK